MKTVRNTIRRYKVLADGSRRLVYRKTVTRRHVAGAVAPNPSK